MRVIDSDVGKAIRHERVVGGGISRGLFWAVTAAALVVALLRRYQFLGDPAFPIGEGGLFVAFSQSILDHGFQMPLQIKYGETLIPFSYPPLAFYLASLASHLTGADLFRVYHDLPVIISLLAVPAFCFLAAHFTASRTIFVCASLLFAQLPYSFVWLTTGGGMPRSLAALLALLAVGVALRALPRPSLKARLLCGVLVGLALLSHLEWGMAAALGVTVAALSRAKGWRRLSFPVSVGVASFLVVLPWVLLIVSRHGLSPFVSGAASSEWSFGFVHLAVTAQIFTPLLIWPAMLGVFKSIDERDFFALGWAVLISIVTPRMGSAAGLAVPATLLSAQGLKVAGDWLAQVAHKASGASFQSGHVHDAAGRSLFGVRLPALALLAALSILLATKLPWIYVEPSLVEQLGRPTRGAMLWIRRETAPTSTFVVITDFEYWWGDRIAEWFPLLAGRESRTTVQGTEWAGPGVFDRKKNEIEALKAVTKTVPDLLPELVRKQYCSADYVALFSKDLQLLSAPFAASSDFSLAYRNGEASIFKARHDRARCA